MLFVFVLMFMLIYLFVVSHSLFAWWVMQRQAFIYIINKKLCMDLTCLEEDSMIYYCCVLRLFNTRTKPIEYIVQYHATYIFEFFHQSWIVWFFPLCFNYPLVGKNILHICHQCIEEIKLYMLTLQWWKEVHAISWFRSL